MTLLNRLFLSLGNLKQAEIFSPESPVPAGAQGSSEKTCHKRNPLAYLTLHEKQQHVTCIVRLKLL